MSERLNHDPNTRFVRIFAIACFVCDLFVGLHRLIPIIYLSFVLAC